MKAAFVEPPVAATIAAAFSNAFNVTISLGYGPPFLINLQLLLLMLLHIHSTLIRSWCPAEFGKANPIASDTHAIVLAVNWPHKLRLMERHTF